MNKLIELDLRKCGFGENESSMRELEQLRDKFREKQGTQQQDFRLRINCESDQSTAQNDD